MSQTTALRRALHNAIQSTAAILAIALIAIVVAVASTHSEVEQTPGQTQYASLK